jgi:hypothetical protein
MSWKLSGSQLGGVRSAGSLPEKLPTRSTLLGRADVAIKTRVASNRIRRGRLRWGMGTTRRRSKEDPMRATL